MTEKIIIFTDLDGTLLHPRTYSFQEALPALELVKKRGIPVILCSSKTRAEIEVWRERLENKHPFISENGGAIFLPKGYFTSPLRAPLPVAADFNRAYEMIFLGKPYSDIRDIFCEIREALNIPVKGFGDMDEKEVAARAGLTLEEAALAKKREFDEPFIFEGKPDKRFLEAIEESGFRWTHGRFFHIMGDNDKGKAVSLLRRLYREEFGNSVAVGLGDNLNDLPLLQEVDYPYLVKREDGTYEQRIQFPNLQKTNGIGPEGWNEAILAFLKKQETT